MCTFKLYDIVIAKETHPGIVKGQEYIILGFRTCKECNNLSLDVGLKDNYDVGQICTKCHCFHGKTGIFYKSAHRFEKPIGLNESIEEIMTKEFVYSSPH